MIEFVTNFFSSIGSYGQAFFAPFFSSNETIFITHSVLIGLFAMYSVRLGRGALTAFMAVCWVLGNLFVIKEAQIFGLNVVTSDAFAIGANIAITLLREYYGEKTAKNGIWIGFYTALFFVIVANIHLTYIPNVFDTTQPHFVALLGRMTRIVCASFFVSVISMTLNLYLFNWFTKKIGERFFGINSFLSLTLSQIIDTTLFAFIALYGNVHSIWHIIVFSSLVKTVCIIISIPSVYISRKIISKHPEL